MEEKKRDGRADKKEWKASFSLKDGREEGAYFTEKRKKELLITKANALITPTTRSHPHRLDIYQTL